MNVKGFEIITEKMEELCTSLLELPAYQEYKHMIEQFAADERSIAQYEQFINTQQLIQAKEQQGAELSPQEMEHYNREEMTLYANTVIRKFLFAKAELENLQQSVNQYFNKTVELGRLPQGKEITKFTHGCGTVYEKTH